MSPAAGSWARLQSPEFSSPGGQKLSNNRLERPGWKEQRRLKERDEKKEEEKEDITFKEEKYYLRWR